MFKREAARLPWPALLLAFALSAAHAAAQAHAKEKTKAKAKAKPVAEQTAPRRTEVYRCAQPSGVRYQGTPCDEHSLPMASRTTADLRTPAQQAETAKATQAGIKLGKELERDRQSQERQSAGGRAISMDAGNQHRPMVGNDSTREGPTLKKKDRHFTAKPPKPKPATAAAK